MAKRPSHSQTMAGAVRDSTTPPIHVAEEPLDIKYSLLNTIGVGAYGKALLAVRRNDQQQVVIKQILLTEVDDGARQEALREAQLLAQFDHVNIVHYLDSVLEDYTLNIVMEYAPHGDLGAVIAQRAADKKAFTEDEIMFWFVQIVLALFHVHSKNVLHRDLKSQNIFISTDNILKLGDFGIARVLSSDTELVNTVIGTPYYLSPEICEDKPYNRKSDVWALGCILYELCTLKRAFNGQSLPALVVQILRGRYPPVPTRYSSPLRGLVESMLKQNPKDRPSVDAILRMSFVRHHVERYAQHVMALSPLQPVDLGVTPQTLAPGVAPNGQQRVRSGASAGTPPKAPTPGSAGRPPPGRAAPRAAASPVSAAPVPAASAQGAASEAQQAGPAAPPRSGSAGSGSGSGRVAQPGSCAQAAGSPAGGKLSATGWMRQQQAALAELEGAFAAQGLGRRASAGSGSDQGDDSSKARSASPAAPVSTPRQTPADDTASAAGVANASPAGATQARLKLLGARQAAREAELEAAKKAVLEERTRKAQAASRRTQDQAEAARQRAAERQREVERQLVEQRAREEERAAKAAEIAAHFKNKEESKARVQQELAAHMAAHQQQLKGVKARVNRSELQQLGAQFAARIQAAAPASGAAGMPLVVVMDEPHTHEPGGSGRLRPQRPRSREETQHGAVSSGPQPASHEGNTKKEQGRKEAGPAPWKAARGASGGKAAAGGFPEVQIYTPFGCEGGNKHTAATTSSQGPVQASGPGRPAACAPETGVGRGAAHKQGVVVTPQPAGGADRPATPAWNSHELLGLLSELQAVLTTEADDGDGEEDGGAGRKGRVGPATCAHGTPTAAVGAAKGPALHLPPEPLAPSQVREGADSQHQRVEAIRMDLERQLGHAVFVQAYNHLRQLQQRSDAEDASSAADATSDVLGQLLGDKLHLARHLQRLITWEDLAFAAGPS